MAHQTATVAVRVTVLMCINLALLATCKAQKCYRAANDEGPPILKNYAPLVPINRRIEREHQAIIPSYRFMCDGNITEWGVDVHRANLEEDQFTYTLDLQVWRPTPTVRDLDESDGAGCYSLVGSNRFANISLFDRVARVTPSPEDYIHFRPGDVVGFYVEDARGSNDGVQILTSPAIYTSEYVWYGRIEATRATSMSGDCPYSAGRDGVLNTLTRAAPVISISAVCNTANCATPTRSTTPPPPFPVALTAGVVVAGGLVLSAIIVTVVVMASVLICLKKGNKTSTSNRQEIVTSLAINASYGRTQAQAVETRTREESLYSYPTERVYHVVPTNRVENNQNTGYATLSH